MNTNFFQHLAALPAKGTWIITIEQQQPEFYVVAVRFDNAACKDEAKDALPPLILRGSPAEFDEGFFQSIQQPIVETAGWFTNMISYGEQLEAAKKQSKMEKDKSGKETKEKNDKESKYNAAMKEAEQLEQAGEFRKAWTALPDPALYPEKADIIKERRAALSEQFAPSLF